MPNYHCSVKVISRSAGRSATAAAAYRSAERIHDEREDRDHDYEPRGGVQYSEIMRPEQSPDRWDDRSTLWNEVEQSERRSDAQLSREVEVSLPRELNRAEQIELIREYTRENFIERGMVADINIHDRNDGNPHAHIMLTTRTCDRDGFGNKDRSWNDRANVKLWRDNWERSQNRALERAYDRQQTPDREREYVDSRSYKEQDKDREYERVPQRHMGPERTQIERQEQSRCEREGREYKPVTEYGRENEYIREINRLIERARQVAREIAERAKERAHSWADRVKELNPTKEKDERTPEQVRADIEKSSERAQEREHQKEVVRDAREQGIAVDRNIPLSQAYEQAKDGLDKLYEREQERGMER